MTKKIIAFKQNNLKFCKNHLLNFSRISMLIFSIILMSSNLFAVSIQKELIYTKYTLPDEYKAYNNKTRKFQWEMIENHLEAMNLFLSSTKRLGVLRNYKNSNGLPDSTKDSFIDKYNIERDVYNNKRDQGIPLYKSNGDLAPTKYAYDGQFVSIISRDNNFVKVALYDMMGEWYIPVRYVRGISTPVFTKTVFIDKKNQNLVTLEKVNSDWVVRSMVPITTGADQLPHFYPTPSGTFIVQEKLLRMNYLKDDSKTELEGYAPFASRFSGGAYMHGVPVDLPKTENIEFSSTLGTYPRSHMCVRNITSHAEFLFEWAESYKTLVFVI